MMNLMIAIRLLSIGEFNNYAMERRSHAACIMKNVGEAGEAWYWLNPERINVFTVIGALKALR